MAKATTGNDAVVEKCLDSYTYSFRKDLLDGKVAFITGGGSGICFTIAEVFMRHGCRTVIAGRTVNRLLESAESLRRATGQQCLPVQMDVRNPKDVIAGVDKALQEFGRIDFLINGAAGNFLCSLETMSYNAFKTVIDIDTCGSYNMCKTVFDKYMKAHGGTIISITSMLHAKGTPNVAHAGAAKAAIESLTKHMAVEWGQYGVNTLCMAPGAVMDTIGLRRLAGEITYEQIAANMPLRRIASREDVANVTLFLVSGLAWMINGSIVTMDGGEWMGGPETQQRIANFKAYKARL